MKKLVLTLATMVALTASAQQFEVVNVEQVPTGDNTMTFHPRFMPDGKLLVSAQNYDGLALIDVKSGEYTLLTEMQGAGYYAVISKDGKSILTRNMNKETFTHDIYVLDVESKALKTVAKEVDYLNQMNFNGGVATLAVEGKTMSKKMVDDKASKASLDDLLITEEDLKIVVYANGNRTVLDPLAGQLGNWDPQYTWTSLSPDKSRILFGCAGDAYVCNLDGSNVVKLGDLRSPSWRGNTHVVGMRDEDDGYYYTKSDIVIVDVTGNNYQQLTTSSDEIKMFPSVSADGSKIAYHTSDGKIYVMTIKEK
ncbi:MAG: PD40 domain-containing protein [Muribaculaceae bacterium]|nr:PD40 domain-containing protein [Muribaculaceae bacterium]MBQ7854491.1 PD40 domain-containing protein [Muribaculaceae bacterium]